MINTDAIINWIKENDYTAQRLAKRAGISNVTLSRIMNGHYKPSMGTLVLLSKATGISPNRLLKDNTDTAA